ncbi:hypothetical protein NQ315_013924 [Exocentrus adspersus]|uniref:CCDC113/CCDC96 coiled-coil domain-containing protein n=1 Tax=Exocentrus adspersus TaxID=1586481 RepID=A0AAV8VRM6_9CUCU|nr:hypothetical protein NQ315_013924 [Exocentrus adspersus]
MDQETEAAEDTSENVNPTEAEIEDESKRDANNEEGNADIIPDNTEQTLEKSADTVEDNEENKILDTVEELEDDGAEGSVTFETPQQDIDEISVTTVNIQNDEKQTPILEGIQEVTQDASDEENESEDEKEGEEWEEYETILESDKEVAAGGDETVSVYTDTRGSILYEMGPRIEDVEPDSVDFLMLDEDVPLKFYKYMDEKDEEEEEEEIVVEEEVTIDRLPYYEKYDILVKEMATEKLKNNILQNKLAKLFKRRKMEHVLKELDQPFDTQDKYGKMLDTYGELSDLDQSQRTAITSELESLRLEAETKCYELNEMFEDLQNQEKEIGFGLIHTKTGKPIPDKLVERLINRQKTQMQTVSSMRLRHIQLKNMVAEKQSAITQLDKIGEDLYLMDYEQLKVENRSYMDKMEEKDEELSRLRNKCQKTIQILAHMREKSAALESDICDLSDDLNCLNLNSIGVRGELNRLKQQRDTYRNMTNKLRDESGLLTQSELLRDMEVSMAELKTLTEELELLKEEHKIKAQQIRNIRKNIEFPPEGLIKKAHKVVSAKTPHRKRLFRGRPSLHTPILPENAFDHLRQFKGKPAFAKKENKQRKPANVYHVL